MEYKMRLISEYFDAINWGTKRVEIRLNDEKRQPINIGDHIIFEEVENPNNKLETIVESRKLFDNFEELIDSYDIKYLGKKTDTKEKLLEILNNFYTKEEQMKYKCLALEVEKYEKSCGVVVFNDKGEVLMVHHIQGHWGIPKGHIEENETEIETAIREVFEETNIKTSVIDGFREVITYCPKEKTIKDVVFFVGNALNTDTVGQESEVDLVKFVKYEEALDLMSSKYSDMKKVLRKANEFYKGV